MLFYSASIALVLVLLFSENVFMKRRKKIKQSLYDDNPDADVFCVSRSRLIRREKAHEFLVVEVVINSSISLLCRFCEQKDNGLPKTWVRQKHLFADAFEEVEFPGVGHNFSLTPSHSLVISKVQEKDTGFYFCKAPYAGSLDKSFNYLVDVIDDVEVNMTGGDLLAWRNYSDTVFAAANEKLKDASIAGENNTRMMFTMVSVWADWSDCNACYRGPSFRTRIGKCGVKSVCNETQFCSDKALNVEELPFPKNNRKDKVTESEDIKKDQRDIYKFSFPLLCRSHLLRRSFPKVYETVKGISDYVLKENCTGICIQTSTKKGPRYKKTLTLTKGDHLTLTCPEATVDSRVEWQFNKQRLRPSEGLYYSSSNTDPKVYVDSFSSLYLYDVTKDESGNFTCFVNGVRMQQVTIFVVDRTIFFTEEFYRHVKYLGFVFLMCFFGYVKIIILLGVRRFLLQRKQEIKEEDSQALLRDDDDLSSEEDDV